MSTSNVKAGAVMLLGVGAFSFMDAGMKVLSSRYPPLQVASLRCLASLPLIVIWVGVRGGFRQLLHVRFGMHVLRSAIGIIMLASFVYGLRRLPLSEAYAIFFVAPLLITVFAALILRERIEWQRWAAVAIGLAGVLIVLHPTGAGVATLAGLAVIICAVGYALSAILVRMLARSDSTDSMVFWVLVLMGLGATVLALPHWVPLSSNSWPAIASVGLAGFLAQWAVTEAFRLGEASFLAPFEYSALVWGLAFDWTLWRTLPGMRALAGAVVIVASGIYLIRRERGMRGRVTADM